jgi:hypothetical protein
VSEIEVKTSYFEGPGEQYTDRTLQLAKARADELGIRNIIVATTRGKVGHKAAELFQGYNLVVVTHVAGFREPDDQELPDASRAAIEATGAKVVTMTHSMGSIGRAVRYALNTYQVDEIIAYTLRNFCEGLKVACEIALMAADAGLVRTDEEAVVVAGSNWGADTAVVLLPAHTTDFFNLRVLEIVCKPRQVPRRKR